MSELMPEKANKNKRLLKPGAVPSLGLTQEKDAWVDPTECLEIKYERPPAPPFSFSFEEHEAILADKVPKLLDSSQFVFEPLPKDQPAPHKLRPKKKYKTRTPTLDQERKASERALKQKDQKIASLKSTIHRLRLDIRHLKKKEVDVERLRFEIRQLKSKEHEEQVVKKHLARSKWKVTPAQSRGPVKGLKRNLLKKEHKEEDMEEHKED